jgi:TetR/AcrR family transcriptional regulator, transcriptional repressor for nem operon
MKVTRQQAERNRKRVLDVAGRLFRENGFDGIGVDGLMKGAGLTHGGFYANFKSKIWWQSPADARSLSWSRVGTRWPVRQTATL